jgi:hypothetical protein
LAEHLSCKEDVVGSIPTPGSRSTRCGSPRTKLAAVELSARDRELLDFERSWWQLGVPKATAIRQQLGLSPASYYHRLRVLSESTAARAYDPLVVLRLQRRRAAQRRNRYEGRSAR